jgi:hypothetical protein
MNYELAKQLKDAGWEKMGDWVGNSEDKEWIPNPTLSELIEACGDKFKDLHRWENNWTCNQGYEVYEFESEGNTADEAVANLWLKLNKN